MSLAEKIIDYVQHLVITEGDHEGDTFTVLDWQSELVHAVVDYQTIALSVARGNGKTTLVAALGCAAIDPEGPLFRRRGYIPIVASSMQQAGIAFAHILHFLRPKIYRDDGKIDSKTWRVADHHHGKSIEHRESGTVLRAVGSDAKRAHGSAPSFAILDEPAQWVGGGEALYNAIVTGLGKQPDARVFIIGTQSDNMEHFFQRVLRSPDAHTWTKIYAADKKDDDFAEETIIKANPSYEHLPTLRKDFDIKIQKVKSGSLSLQAYRAYQLNKGTPEHMDREVLVETEAWERVVKRKPAKRSGPVCVGIDLGGGISMSAIAFYWPKTGRLDTYGAFPQEPNLAERGRNDNVEDLYERMLDRKEIMLIGKYETDNVGFLKHWLPSVAEFERIGISGDNYAKTKIAQALYELGMNPDKDVDHRRVGRGPSGKEDVEAFQSEVLTGHLSVGYNLCLEHAIAKAIVIRDSNGNPALDKSSHKGRIDVIQAAVLAVGMGHRWRKPAKGQGLQKLWSEMLESGEPMIRSV